jgi:hypothetical protein
MSRKEGRQEVAYFCFLFIDCPSLPPTLPSRSNTTFTKSYPKDPRVSDVDQSISFAQHDKIDQEDVLFHKRIMLRLRRHLLGILSAIQRGTIYDFSS